MYEKELAVVDRNAARINAISDKIWDLAELPYCEYESSALLQSELEKEGFKITRNVADIPTAFTATYGSGSPKMGILAEFDALPDLSQEANVTEPRPRAGTNNGHGCGHHLFAGGSFGAALAVKAHIDATGKGSVTLFGCPAEEGGAGKVFMARRHVFNDTDAIVSWHPEKMYMPRTRPSLANIMVDYAFKGLAAHAGGSPQKGRSALDAVTLMNVGANFLREHMDLTSRIHYAVIDTGGEAPNIVQSHAKVRYLIRAVTSEDVRILRERVDRIAQGAAMMTDTEVTATVLTAYSNLITIPTLQQTAYEMMKDIPVPVPTEEELAFGRALRETMPLTAEEKKDSVYATEVLVPAPPKPHGGSTDTSDVSWNCPTLQLHIGTWVKGTPGHSWQMVAQGKSSYAHKATVYASKAVAATIMRVMDEPERLAKIKAEHAERAVGGYVCPIPDDIQPPIPERK